MTRPTTKDVEFALEWFAQGSGPGAALAAEVRALIAERDAILQAVGVAQDVEEGRDPIEAARSVREANALYCEDQNAKVEEIGRMQESIDLYRDQLARVGELPAKLRERARLLRDKYHEYCACNELADVAEDIESALKGGE